MYSVFEYYSNNILFVFVFGHNSEPEYYSYSYSAKYFCTNIILIRIRSFWKKRILFVFVFGPKSDSEYYSYSYSVQKTVFAHLCSRLKIMMENAKTKLVNFFVARGMFGYKESFDFDCIYVNRQCFSHLGVSIIEIYLCPKECFRLQFILCPRKLLV